MNKKIILIIEIIAVVAIVSGFIYLEPKFFKRQEPVSTPLNMHQPTTGPESVKPPTAPPPGQTAGQASFKKYSFIKTDDYNTKTFEFLYPSNASIVNNASTKNGDKLVYKKDGKDCWLLIVPPPMGMEGGDANLSTDEKEITLNGQKWGNLIWKSGSKTILYGFKNYEDTAYFFQANPDNLNECADSYMQILSTFKFMK